MATEYFGGFPDDFSPTWPRPIGGSSSTSDQAVPAPAQSSGAQAAQEAVARPAIDVDEFQRRLKRQMKDALGAHRAWLAASDTYQCAEQAVRHLPAELPEMPRLPEPSRIEQYLDAAEAMRIEQFGLQAVAAQAFNVRALAGRELAAAVQALQQSADQAGADNQQQWQPADVLIYAARDLLQRLGRTTVEELRPIIVSQPPLSPDAQAILASGKQTASRAVKLYIEARRYLDDLDAAMRDYRNLSKEPTGLKPPARDSKEEIERYVRQIEDWMEKRQRYHRNAATLVAKKSFWYELLGACRDDLSCLELSLQDMPPSCAQRYALSACAAEVSNHLWGLRSAIDRGEKNTAGHFEPKESMPIASEQEKETIARLRDLMRNLARKLALLNEAAGAKELALQGTNIPHVSMHGLSRCQTYHECRQWLAAQRVEQRRARALSRRHEIKIGLIEHGIRHCRDAVQSASTALRRAVITSIPFRKRLPCDTLRIVLNAAAWMHKVHSERYKAKRQTGDFPVY